MSNISSFISEFSVEDFTSKHQVVFYDYWQKICGDRMMPSRADIHPEDIVKILPHIIMFEKKENDFIVRLMGTRCAENLGEGTGNNLTTLEDGIGAFKRFNWCFENKKPYFHVKPYDNLKKNHVTLSAIVMPLSDNNNDVNMVILICDFY